MMSGFGWAKHPMVNRIDKMHKDVPITLLYGSRSWVDNSAGEIIKEKRIDSFVNLQVIFYEDYELFLDRAMCVYVVALQALIDYYSKTKHLR